MPLFSVAKDPPTQTQIELAAASATLRIVEQPAELVALIDCCRAGDKQAFRALFTQHRERVARVVYRMLGPSADLEDLIQEVFVQVFRSLKDFKAQSKFSTWLHRVTVNVVLMHRRQAKSRPVFDGLPLLEPADDKRAHADEEFARQERVAAFYRLLNRLSEKKRTVFILHEIEGLSPTEIASTVNAPALTVRTRLFYARRELALLLKEEPYLAHLTAQHFDEAKELL